MSNNIDDIFKEGLNDMEFSGREAIWERMEKELDKKPVPAANKKRVAYLLLLLGIVAGASFLASHFNTAGTVVSSKVKGVAGSAKAGGIATKDYSTAINSDAKTVGEHSLVSENALTAEKAATAEMQPAIDDNKLIRSSDEKKLAAAHFTAKAKHIVQLRGKTHSSVLQDADAVLMNDDETLPEEMIAGRMQGLFEKDLYTTAATVNTEITAAPAPFLQLPLRTKKPAADGKISLALVAGSDVFTIGKGAGYYAGLTVSRSFSKGMSLSFGVNYSSSNLSESYRLSNKPSQLQQADAEISRVSMLRFPIMIEQQIGKGKFTAVAGLVPVYILDAAIYNLPPSVSGNPANYRKFTIDDIRRLNALFSAGIRYNIVRKFAVELSGSYGLTELVKNSYINQSSVNGNFKNVQVGLVYLLR